MTTSLARFDIAGQVAVVTGASSGIGKHLACALAEAGAKVVVVARRSDSIQQLADDIGGHAIAQDLCSVSDFPDFAADLSQPFGAPQLLINAAGVNHRQAPEDITESSWNQTLKLNLSVPFFLSRALVPGMQGCGSIINIASLQSVRAFPNSMPYGASKGGVAQLTRAMAEAWSPLGIRANALAPGFFPTELTQAVFDNPEKAAANAAQTCMGRNGALDDLVGPALFLCSAASSYMTGQVLYVDGGFTAK
ncbi:MAG: NAD(P)-dependent dehydrogenase (short-subunit alcohol dehydrogenase family) [bacterium]|jgi:NAD(P)-dependent dehydrogenase (short-subunit alcohol dehydrogenase family)